MGILDTTAPDLDRLAEGFGRWARANGLGRLETFTGNDSGAGYSNATYFARLDGADLVIRSGPPDPQRALFPDYDIPRQYRVLRALEAHTEIPVPRCHLLETDPSLFGTPFFVMDRVDGQIPADQPSYLTAGVVVEATDAQRERMWTGTVDLLAAVARVDWRAAGLDFLAWPDSTRSPIEQELDLQENRYRWGRQGSPPFPELERALDWLRANLPTDEPAGLLWGDARLPNVIYRDHEPVCLLDWEMAGIGNPESDLAWFLLRQFDKEHNRNPADARPRPCGFASDSDTVAHYEQAIGRPVEHLRFYRAFNAFKTLAWMQRFFDLLRDSGAMDADQAEAGKLAGGSMLDQLMIIVDGTEAR